MSLSALLILIPGICYTLAAMGYAYRSDWPLCIVYTGYAWANVGLLWLDRLSQKH